MNGGSRMNAINTPLVSPSNRPKPIPAAIPSMPNCGESDASMATTADAAKIAPTDRSMPAVKITKVMPAARTMFTEACWVMIDRFCTVKKFSLIRAKPRTSNNSTGSMPTVRNRLRICSRLPTATAAPLLELLLANSMIFVSLLS